MQTFIRFILNENRNDGIGGSIGLLPAIFLLLFSSIFPACQRDDVEQMTPKHERSHLTIEQAERLAVLPLSCIAVEYPNKLGQVLGSDDDLKPPRELRPAFFGCYDWHSAVHAHWSLVTLLQKFTDLNRGREIIERLESHISPENIAVEIDFFRDAHNTTFERTYGWAWLLKLAEALHTWDHPVAERLERNLSPLAELITGMYLEYLPKLQYPIRVGEHTNTAFGLSLAYDYARTVGNEALISALAGRAKEFFLADRQCPISWEPGGYDFLSPCLEEAFLMSKILERDEYSRWLADFLPELNRADFELVPGVVSDRKDGKLVHLDGLNFSRARCLAGIAETLPEYSSLMTIADGHIRYSFPHLVGDSYEGSHWLGTFAIYALVR